MSQLIYFSLIILGFSLIISTSISSLFHILIIIPIINSLRLKEWKILPKSAWALIAYSVIIILSVVLNQDIASYGYKPILKIKYFLLAALGIMPIYKYRSEIFTHKRTKIILNVVMVSASIATMAGIIALYTGYHPIKFSKACHLTRNCGMSGMYMNYAHTLVLLQVIFTGLLIYRKKINHLLKEKFILAAFIINLIGLYLSFTRGAWIGFFAAVPFFFIREHVKKFLISGVALVALSGLIYLASPKVQETFNSRKDSNDERIGSWKASIKAFEERKILGYGYLNYEPHSPEIKYRYNINNAYFKGHSHNNFLQVLADTGLLGFIAFVAWLTLWIKEVYQRSDLVAQVTLPVIICFIVAGLTQSTIILANNQFAILGIYMISVIKPKEEEL
ncbi:MAG: O-antigen ligase family protein [Bacteriovoracaceae bacterium]|nr:O-antigen ligase family protein [Bacteriovoracaceae bacterium]